MGLRTQKTIEPKIINISTRELSNEEIKLLKRGLKFTPTPKSNTTELKTDIKEFGRKLRLLEHFNDSHTNHDNSLAKNKSNFVPPKSTDEYLNIFLEATSNYHQQNTQSPNTRRNNLTRNEQIALDHLKNDNSIIIKEADKGGATVIMDKAFYQMKIHELLSDTEFYMELANGNIDASIMNKIERFLQKFHKETNKYEKEYIKKFTWRTSNLYGLPKIHKSSEIKEAIKEQNSEYIKVSAPPNLKIRPIVAGPSSPTHRLSNFIDLILKPLCKHVPSFIRDDFDFLNVLPQEINENSILVSFDVVNLYTNIPHELGLTALKHWIDNFSDSLERPFSTEFILEAASIVLKENTFHFDNKFYKQIQGTAMGTKMAPTYATLVMGYLETLLYKEYEKLYGTEERDKFIKTFKRFLDDCFLIWERNEDDLKKLHDILNSLHDKITFTMEHDNDKLPFLDILLYKKGNKLMTDIFYKDTDTHQYLNFYSCHPKHNKNNIPYCLARRICSIVSDPEIKTKRLNELEEFLNRQNYPKKIIMKGIQKAASLPITELRSTKDKSKNKNILPLVITHNPNNPQIVNMIKQDITFLNNSGRMKSIMDKTDLIISRRQPKNLKRHLTQAKFVENENPVTVTKCNEPRCGTCNVIITGDSITLRNGKHWKVKSEMNCKSRNIIYIITCPKCDSFYIGQTEHLRKRVTLHREQIQHEEYRYLAVSEHLAKCSDGEFRIMPIYQCGNANRLVREMKEKDIISILKPNLNST